MHPPARIIAALCIASASIQPVLAIVGGSYAPAGEYPYIASVLRAQLLGGATFINPRQLLSAASCIGDIKASSLRIRSGSLRHASGGKITGLTKVIIHPGYNKRTLENDIAILNLAEPVDGITPAMLPTSSEPPAAGSTVVIAGWGSTSDGGTSPRNLKRTSLPIIDVNTCQDVYNGITTIFPGQLCDGVSYGGEGSCLHDEGGPVLQGNTLVGVLSQGKGCAQAGHPDVDTNVGFYLDWIESHLIKE